MRTLLLALLLSGLVWAKVEMKTHSSAAPKATVTVVHYGAPWCGPCVAMEPAWTKFETDYKKKVNLVLVNIEEKGTPELKKYGKLQEDVDGLPLTLWLDANGKVVKSEIGKLEAKQLASQTDKALKPKGN